MKNALFNKKALYAPVALLALSLAAMPAANAQSLSERQQMDSFDRIQAAYQAAQADRDTALTRAVQANETQGRDYLAERKSMDQAELIQAGYQKVQAQRALAVDNDTGVAPNYLEQRRNLDTLDNINQALGNS